MHIVSKQTDRLLSVLTHTILLVDSVALIQEQ